MIKAMDKAPRPQNRDAVALPLSYEELLLSGRKSVDFVYIIGDAYVDHPSFGPAVISRVLESRGYSVGIVAQPEWRSIEDFTRFGRPNLAFLVSAGNMDSMVNHYTAAKKRRASDAFTPGGAIGKRPNRATIVYVNRIKQAYRSVPVIIGGVEASLRRFAHYDYWDDRVRRSILIESGADLLIYGMGEKPIIQAADALSSGLDIKHITYIPGTCYYTSSINSVYGYEEIASFNDVASDKKTYARAFMKQQTEHDPIRGKVLVQPHDKGYLVVNPPAEPLSGEEMDAVYELPYTRKPHPSYKENIPALQEVEFSLVSCRGCFGSCAFCALSFHQGRFIQARSHESLVREARMLSRLDGFKGYIHDVGGPTANFRKPACKKQPQKGACAGRNCLGYHKCPSVEVDHSDYTALLKKLREVEGVKKVFVRSGIRYDYVMYDKDDSFMKELVKHHVSGRLKVAPEHVDENVLKLMGKPSCALYDKFCEKYGRLSRGAGKEQYIVPYFMSSHPGSDLNSAVELAVYLKKTGQRPEQVQDFYPTPGTLSTCMYHTGLDPKTMRPVYVPKSAQDKALQRALIQFFMPQYQALARKALIMAGREDLIGRHPSALVPNVEARTVKGRRRRK